jgi:hypothetical protein
LAVVVAALALLLLAAPAAAQTPSGQGLDTIADQGITLTECSDPSLMNETHLSPPGGGAVSFISDGRTYVIRFLSIEGVVTPEEGDPFPVSIERDLGQKAGLETVSSCTFTVSGPGFEGTGSVTLARVR